MEKSLRDFSGFAFRLGRQMADGGQKRKRQQQRWKRERQVMAVPFAIANGCDKKEQMQAAMQTGPAANRLDNVQGG